MKNPYSPSGTGKKPARTYDRLSAPAPKSAAPKLGLPETTLREQRVKQEKLAESEKRKLAQADFKKNRNKAPSRPAKNWDEYNKGIIPIANKDRFISRLGYGGKTENMPTFDKMGRTVPQRKARSVALQRAARNLAQKKRNEGK